MKIDELLCILGSTAVDAMYNANVSAVAIIALFLTKKEGYEKNCSPLISL